MDGMLSSRSSDPTSGVSISMRCHRSRADSPLQGRIKAMSCFDILTKTRIICAVVDPQHIPSYEDESRR